MDLKVDNFGSLGLKWQGAAVHVHFYSNISIETLDGGMLFYEDGVKFRVLFTAAATKGMRAAVWEILATAFLMQNRCKDLILRNNFAHKISTVSLYFLFTTQLSQGSTPLTLDRPSSGYPSLSSSTYSKRTAAAAINLQYVSCMFDARAR